MSGRVIFSAEDANGPLIGRLDTVSGHLEVWSCRVGGAVPVGLAPDGTIFYTSGDQSSDVVQLDPTTGVFTDWPLVDQPLWGFGMDGSGDIFFLQLSSDFQGLARFSPGTGRLTHWATADLFGWESLDPLSGHVFFASSSPIALEALDPAVAGTDTILSPFSETVTPRTSDLTPTKAVLSGQQASAQVTRLTAQRQTTGAFSSWSLPDAGDRSGRRVLHRRGRTIHCPAGGRDARKLTRTDRPMISKSRSGGHFGVRDAETGAFSDRIVYCWVSSHATDDCS